MNKAILTSLLSSPIPDHVRDLVFCLGMDWTGSVGYIFCVQGFEDAYIAKSICTLNLPKTINDIGNFLSTLDNMYIRKNHQEQLMDILLSAINSKKVKSSLDG
ncbi:hypothetical protein VTP01DRAFT_5278 [Rhizomucor pusillus]|uniref:uncharacterized protein n=1 Tax=Rhizomucor pusillus TaxID=4840 RepID=UPI00374205F9